MKRKHRRAKERRWMAKRQKTFYKQRFAEGFRNWFVQRGVIK
ncbi:hypothetical protein GCM10007425_29370 [Lysinibacillus alkalisoli]|uniref:DUF3983 domain-containing protein n=1 Tax=Lysinibacillus alkalisoli TaxID=1911548 RepID=A0A917GAA1_9BACI|nr:hypothetical protein [Lysinibacillus alkalisoli]GGG32833.1 hypothetical protein GCM10007425_29370 [Lysinibacillus alkalisoli]